MEETSNDETQECGFSGCKVWRLSQEQANELEEVLKTMVKKRHGKLPSGLFWKRCLIEEGIEPNPGPSFLITIHSLYVDGKHRAWKFMNQFAADREDEQPEISAGGMLRQSLGPDHQCRNADRHCVRLLPEPAT